MKFPAVLLAFVVSIATADAYRLGHEHSLGHVARHHDISLVQRQPTTTLERKQRKRCKLRPSGAASTTAPTSSSSKPPAAAAPTSTKKSSSAAPKPTQNNVSSGGGSSGGNVLNLSSACGPSRAEAKPSKLSGPNGHIDFLNCGIEGGGWNPPKVTLDNVIYKSLDEALAMSNSPFSNCRPYLDAFKRYGAETGVPAIMIAAIAMQESSCNKNTVGGGGEQGLMQITKEKCGGAPGGDCKNPDFNIRTGAYYYANRIKASGGNLLLATGNYNGWVAGMDVGYATRARHSSCCRCQNNLDYLHQFFNGWIQGVNAYSANMKKYDNLAVCG